MSSSELGRGRKAKGSGKKGSTPAPRRKGGASQTKRADPPKIVEEAAALRDAIQEKSGQQRAARETARARAVEEAEKRRALVHALHYCCYAEGDDPIAAAAHEGPPIGRRLAAITVDSIDWASRMVGLATALRRFPDLLADIRERPIPDEGDGIDAGRKLFELALEDKPPGVIARWIDEFRAVLCPWEGQCSGQDANDSELGIWTVFSQLARYCDGFSWKPPVVRVTLGELAAAAKNVDQNLNLVPRVKQWCRLHEADHPAIVAFLQAPGSGSPMARAVRRLDRERSADEAMTIVFECEAISDADFHARVIHAHRIADLVESASWPPPAGMSTEDTLATALTLIDRRRQAFDGTSPTVAPLATAMDKACATIVAGHGGWDLLIPLVHAIESPWLRLTSIARTVAPTMDPHPRSIGAAWTETDHYGPDSEYWPVAQTWWRSVRDAIAAESMRGESNEVCDMDPADSEISRLEAIDPVLAQAMRQVREAPRVRNAERVIEMLCSAALRLGSAEIVIPAADLAQAVGGADDRDRVKNAVKSVRDARLYHEVASRLKARQAEGREALRYGKTNGESSGEMRG